MRFATKCALCAYTKMSWVSWVWHKVLISLSGFISLCRRKGAVFREKNYWIIIRIIWNRPRGGLLSQTIIHCTLINIMHLPLMSISSCQMWHQAKYVFRYVNDKEISCVRKRYKKPRKIEKRASGFTTFIDKSAFNFSIQPVIQGQSKD